MSQSLAQTYSAIKPAVVAIVGNISLTSDFSPIIGTGFIVDESGIIATNHHVIEAIGKLPKRKDQVQSRWPASVILFYNAPGIGMGNFVMPIKATMSARLGQPTPYESERPDIALIRVAYNDLPAVSLESTPTFHEGDDVATAGFPLGDQLFRSHGKIGQINPTLRKGIIGSILPFPCDHPHGLLLDMEIQGGSSGSPLFRIEEPKIIGIMYGNMNGTGLSYAVPSHYIASLLKVAKQSSEWKDHDIGEALSLKARIKKSLEDKNHPGIGDAFKPIGRDQIINEQTDTIPAEDHKDFTKLELI